MKNKYDISSFIDNFKSIISVFFGMDATNGRYIISPVYDPTKNETGEDSAFRLIILSEDNIGGKKLSFEDAVSVMAAFEPHFPTKIEIAKQISTNEPNVFVVQCSTRVRKPSAIANIEKQFAPFVIREIESE